MEEQLGVAIWLGALVWPDDVYTWFVVIPLFSFNVWNEGMWLFLASKHKQAQSSAVTVQCPMRGRKKGTVRWLDSVFYIDSSA